MKNEHERFEVEKEKFNEDVKAKIYDSRLGASNSLTFLLGERVRIHSNECTDD